MIRLRGLRGRAGLSQRSMAERLGIRQHHISEMEKGLGLFPLRWPGKLAGLLISHMKFFYKWV
ncbi:MAG: helix-turn-helix domain-containing protein [Deltaproteobacteria bacterium]|nr:helix-turn-helix domain-containing protein [Deltaproteobacteria bacterium]